MDVTITFCVFVLSRNINNYRGKEDKSDKSKYKGLSFG